MGAGGLTVAQFVASFEYVGERAPDLHDLATLLELRIDGLEDATVWTVDGFCDDVEDSLPLGRRGKGKAAGAARLALRRVLT